MNISQENLIVHKQYSSVFDIPDLVNLVADLCEDDCLVKLSAVLHSSITYSQ